MQTVWVSTAFRWEVKLKYVCSLKQIPSSSSELFNSGHAVHVYICPTQIFTWPELGCVCVFLGFLLYSPLQTDRASELEHCSMSWLQLSARPSIWALSQETPKKRANCSTNVPRSWTPEGQTYVTEQTQALQSQAGAANSRLRNTAVPKKSTHPQLCSVRLHNPCGSKAPQH